MPNRCATLSRHYGRAAAIHRADSCPQSDSSSRRNGARNRACDSEWAGASRSSASDRRYIEEAFDWSARGGEEEMVVPNGPLQAKPLVKSELALRHGERPRTKPNEPILMRFGRISR